MRVSVKGIWLCGRAPSAAGAAAPPHRAPGPPPGQGLSRARARGCPGRPSAHAAGQAAQHQCRQKVRGNFLLHHEHPPIGPLCPAPRRASFARDVRTPPRRRATAKKTPLPPCAQVLVYFHGYEGTLRFYPSFLYNDRGNGGARAASGLFNARAGECTCGSLQPSRPVPKAKSLCRRLPPAEPAASKSFGPRR